MPLALSFVIFDSSVSAVHLSEMTELCYFVITNKLTLTMNHQKQTVNGDSWEPVTVSLYRSDRKMNIYMGRRFHSSLKHDNLWRLRRVESAHRLFEAIDGKIHECRRDNTRRGYEVLRNFLEVNCGDIPIVIEAVDNYAHTFAEALQSKQSGSPVMRNQLTLCLSGVLTYARRRGWLPEGYRMKLPRLTTVRTTHRRDMDPQQLRALRELARRRIADDPLLTQRETYALALFELDYAMQGLAPVDLALLRINMIRRIPVQMADGTWHPAYIVDTSRRKTGVPVRIVMDGTAVAPILTVLMSNRGHDDYLLPILSDDESLTERQQMRRIANWFRTRANAMNKALATLPSGQRPEHRVTYYYARHAYCQSVDHLDIAPHILRRLIGHTPTTLERHYLAPLTLADQLTVSERLLAPSS